jgi:amylosucrase
VWTTFNAFQWDLNWTNPDVLIEFTELILWLANLGVEVLRLDAIAFLWKRLGTTCQNEPEVHAITQVLRTVARIACPALAFKAEAIVAPHDLVQYLGAGPHYGKVSDLAYHNTLMVQIWSALATADSRLAAHTLEGLPRAPSTSGWITYVRCHDDIGWAITDEDAGALGLSGYHHRRFLSDWYSGSFPGSPARGLVFQENAETGDRRISGMTSALVGLSAAREPEEVDAALGRYFLTHAIVYGWGGIPVIWSGDEIGMSNDLEWANEPGHETDNRWAHRPRLDWRRAEQRHDLRTVPGRIFAGLQHLTRVRATFPQLHASVRSEVLWVDDGGVLATVRRAPIGPMVCLYNVTPELRSFPAWRVAEIGIHDPWDAISGRPVEPDADGFFWMTPYAAWWLGERDDHMSEGAKPMSAEASALLSGGAGREAVGSQRRGAPMASRAEATGARSTLVRTSYSIGRVWTLPSSGRAQSSRPVLTQVGLQRRGGWPWPSPSTAIATCCCSPPS